MHSLFRLRSIMCLGKFKFGFGKLKVNIACVFIVPWVSQIRKLGIEEIKSIRFKISMIRNGFSCYRTLHQMVLTLILHRYDCNVLYR